MDVRESLVIHFYSINSMIIFKHLLICLDRPSAKALLWAKCLSLNVELYLSSGDFHPLSREP